MTRRSTTYRTVCETCGRTFDALSDKAHYCPACRRAAAAERARRNRLHDIGSAAYSAQRAEAVRSLCYVHVPQNRR